MHRSSRWALRARNFFDGPSRLDLLHVYRLPRTKALPSLANLHELHWITRELHVGATRGSYTRELPLLVVYDIVVLYTTGYGAQTEL